MWKTNYHTHSEYCDGVGKPEEYVKTALRKGFTALGFSGHAPLPFPNSWTMDDENLPIYLNEIQRLKKQYGDRIEIYLGVESDYLDEKHNALSSEVQALNLDYQISSVHMLQDRNDGEYYSVDGPPDELQHLIRQTFGGSVQDFIGAYYQQVQRMVTTGGFDIIGHLDLIKKHNRQLGFFSEEESWYRKIIEETLEAIAGSGLMLEVNTGAISRGYTREPYPSPWIIELCAQADIPVILTADAHKPEHIDFAFPETEQLLISKGYHHGWALIRNRWQEVQFG